MYGTIKITARQQALKGLPHSPDGLCVKLPVREKSALVA